MREEHNSDLLTRWIVRSPDKLGFPKSYVELLRRNYLGLLKVVGVFTLLMPIAYFCVDSAVVLAVLASIWIFLASLLIFWRYPPEAGIQPFFTMKIEWQSEPSVCPERQSDQAQPQRSPGFYRAVFRNYMHLARVFGDGSDCEQFLFEYRDGLVIPWSGSLSGSLIQFLSRICDHPELLTPGNGFIDIQELDREVREILHYVQVAWSHGSDSVLVIVDLLNGLEKTNGVF